MGKIKIISTTLIPSTQPIRGGGEEQSLASNVAKKISASFEMSSELIAEQIANTISVIDSAIDKIDSVSQKFSVDEITLSLAISADGDIGLVSAGAEATIEIKFKKKD